MQKQTHEILDEMKKLQAELAQVQDQMAPFRIQRRAVRDAIFRDCFSLDEGKKIVKRWKPMGAENIRKLTEVNAWAADGLRDLMPLEASLKEARRLLEIELKAAKNRENSSRIHRGKIAEKPRKPHLQNVPRYQADATSSLRIADAFPQCRPAVAEASRKSVDERAPSASVSGDGQKELF